MSTRASGSGHLVSSGSTDGEKRILVSQISSAHTASLAGSGSLQQSTSPSPPSSTTRSRRATDLSDLADLLSNGNKHDEQVMKMRFRREAQQQQDQEHPTGRNAAESDEDEEEARNGSFSNVRQLAVPMIAIEPRLARASVHSVPSDTPPGSFRAGSTTDRRGRMPHGMPNRGSTSQEVSPSAALLEGLDESDVALPADDDDDNPLSFDSHGQFQQLM
jgi:hypothetical protein